MDALQSDIDSLEAEKTAIQSKLNNLTKKHMYDSLTKSSPSGVDAAVGMSFASDAYCMSLVGPLRGSVHMRRQL